MHEAAGFVRVSTTAQGVPPTIETADMPLSGTSHVALAHDAYLTALFDDPALVEAVGERLPPPHDIVMRDAWFPLAHALAVGARVVRRALYSHPFFLRREDGRAIAS